MSQQKKQALLQWLSKVIHAEVSQQKQLRTGQLLMQLCNKLPGINLTYNTKYDGWKDGYLRLKTVHEQISSFMRNVIKYQFPNTIETVNLVQMAKGHDDDGLVNLLQTIFLVTFNLGPDNSQIFVQKAMMVLPQHQQQLYQIVQNNTVPSYQNDNIQQFEQKYQKQRQKVTSLITAIQSISSQNDSLRQSLIIQSQQIKKLTQQLKKVQQQRDRLKRQLLQSYNKSQHELQQQLSSSSKHRNNTMMNDHHEQMIEILKMNIMEQEQSYSQQIFELKEKIQSLEEQLDIYKGKVHDLEESAVKGVVDHSACVSVLLYKKEKQQLTAKLTEASAKEWKTQLECTKLHNQLSQLKEKNKKLNDENKNIQNNPTCSKQQANKLKLQFYTQIRDKLKRKLEQSMNLDKNKTIKKSLQNQMKNIIGDDDL